MTETNAYIRKGNIFNVMLGTERNGSIQHGGVSGVRPCIVMSNKIACNVSPVLIVVPITSRHSKRVKSMPTHLEIDNILPKKSVALFEQILTVNRFQLIEKIANLTTDLLEEANEKVKISLGLIPQYA